jgi:hypothetical protein
MAGEKQDGKRRAANVEHPASVKGTELAKRELELSVPWV